MEFICPTCQASLEVQGNQAHCDRCEQDFTLEARCRVMGLPAVAPLSTEPPRKPAAAAPGRNDPCPCGSGKKYKKCCGAEGGQADA